MRLLLCAVLAVLAASSFGAEVYRSIDVNGTVVYSDRPGEGTVRIVLATPGVASTPSSQAAAPTAAAAGPANAAAQELGGEVREEPTPAEQAEQRARNCAVAQERAELYRVSHRLYRTLPNGEREYLSDAELDDARGKAEADVVNWCS